MIWLLILALAAFEIRNAFALHRLRRRLHMLTDPAPILALLSDISTKIDTLVASQTAPVDLQPLADAATAIDAKLTAARTPAA